MEIPPVKKSTFYIICVIVLLAGMMIGGLLIGYGAYKAIYKNKAAFCAVPTAEETFDKMITEATIPSSTINRVTSLAPNQTIIGKVTAASTNQITLEVNFANPINPRNSTTTTVKVPVGTSDKIIRFERVADSSELKEVNSSTSGIKSGDIVTVKVLSDGSKVIYLPTK
ncbi:MAG: hypothetical protein HY432_03645 [Candidatus Liptonbacteria bacterium]|nr:hypothetical protein [Candidatus Liptonbacteria bacterium]